MAEEHPVQLYIYDLSGGFAAQLSPTLIGKEIVLNLCLSRLG